MLGENIYKLRKTKKLSQEQLSEKIKVTRQTISNWELGETTPNPEQLKLLSTIFNISIDELLNNNIKELLVEKMSNTEKLAGIIIKILKIAGILILILVVIDLISLLLFTTVKKEITTSNVETVTIHCSIKKENYEISISSEGYFNCSNCSKKIQTELYHIIDQKKIDESLKNITKYFKDKNGNCED